ncbi:MAG TPA: RNA methyltransferase [Prolixibacteraceae bacterium]|nr:RNA methyltransferase [Prolixibacteraceae bacterium]
MIGKNTIKLIKSLLDKKNRIEENLFVVEGDKIVSEVLSSGFKIERLFVTNTFLEKHSFNLSKASAVIEVLQDEIKKASLLKTPQNCIAICQLPAPIKFPSEMTEPLTLFLDDVQDPGNMGTIIRICDWFGIKQVYCSPGCADLFNPKVIQASMGSFCRVDVITSTFDKVETIAHASGVKICGAFLDGENIYTSDLNKKTLLIMGNEGNGINGQIAGRIDRRVSIPQFAVNNKGAESLNVAVATAVICAEFKRQFNYSK